MAHAKEANIEHLVKYAKDGYAILSAIPSCSLMFKQELPLMFPNCEDTESVQDAMLDLFEYLIARRKDGLLRTDFKKPLGKISYHIPCHGRVQNIGKPVAKLMANGTPDYISSDCQLADHHIEQIMTKNNLVRTEKPAQLAHPLSLARIAYGIE